MSADHHLDLLLGTLERAGGSQNQDIVGVGRGRPGVRVRLPGDLIVPGLAIVAKADRERAHQPADGHVAPTRRCHRNRASGRADQQCIPGFRADERIERPLDPSVRCIARLGGVGKVL